MYDQSFNIRTLSGCFQPEDFKKWKKLKVPDERQKTILLASIRAQQGFLGVNLSSSVIRGKNVYWLDEVSDILVLRKVKNNIVKTNRMKSVPRTVIVNSLKSLVSECSQYRVYRLDIKSFYESFKADFVYKHVDGLRNLSVKTKQLLKELLYSYHINGGHGIPRGLSVSAVLSESLMQSFDEFVRGEEAVFYYARYVDDIIIVTGGYEENHSFLRSLRSALPQGLKFNNGKKFFVSDVIKKSPKSKQNTHVNILFSFEYLGYRFVITDNVIECNIRGLYRQVDIDLARNKVNKIKSRIVYSIISFNKNSDFDLLCERLMFLSGNFSVPDSDRMLKFLSGIHYNYPLLNARNSEGLSEIDSFLKKAILSSYGKVFSKFFMKLTQEQKCRLLKFSFIRGHEKCYFFHYSATKMFKIQECWKYV
ncbi:antiviral reverse transcriptase Drt3a [Photorhabdus sp. CRCIA-P01]|uniref:antiviral reverse transcriptase Drt3a n=1 Tax=Photorhabdus sp. CRCIA-P01 TaxID=2019570 RepID=UPI000E59F9BC|nr:antiviral reverse transcriptase Drt3a [Photorhabdus sp. CRCIA-P01]